MKGSLLHGLPLLLLAVSASAVTLDTPNAAPQEPTVRDALGAGSDVERELSVLERQEGSARQELAELARESERLKATTLARGRAYARLARAGLLPLGGGFQSFVEHAARLERLHRSLARDLAQERHVAERRAQVAKQLAGITNRREPLLAQQRALSQAQTALLVARDAGSGVPARVHGRRLRRSHGRLRRAF